MNPSPVDKGGAQASPKSTSPQGPTIFQHKKQAVKPAVKKPPKPSHHSKYVYSSPPAPAPVRNDVVREKRTESTNSRPGDKHGIHSLKHTQQREGEGKKGEGKRLLTVKELWTLLKFDENKEVNASEKRKRAVKALLEKHRGVFISPGRTTGKAPSEFEFAIELKPDTRPVKQHNRPMHPAMNCLLYTSPSPRDS